MMRSASKALFQQASIGQFKTKSPYIFRGWWIVLISIFGLTLSIGPVMVYSFGIFVKPLASSFSASRGSISLAITILNISAAICLPLFGYLIDRFGGRKVITIALIGLAICLFGLSRVKPPLWQLLFLYGLAGAIGSGSSPVSFSRVITNWFNRRRGLALGIATTGIGLGGLILPLLSQFLIEKVGWRQSYMILGIACLLAAPVIGFFFKNRPEDEGLVMDGTNTTGQTISVKPPEGVSVKEALQTQTFWMLFFIFLFVAACGIGTITHLAPMLTDRGFSGKDAAIATSIFGAANILGRIINGWLVDKFFAPFIAAASLLGAAVGIALLWGGLGGTLIAVAFIGLAIGTEADVMPFLLSRYFGRLNLGILFGIVFSAYTIGAATGPYLYGMAFDRTGSYQVPLACTFILFILTIGLTLMLKKYKPVDK